MWDFFPPKTSRLKSRTISPSWIFQKSKVVYDFYACLWRVVHILKCDNFVYLSIQRVKHHSRPKWFIGPLVSPT
jgi:hypothetical protein